MKKALLSIAIIALTGCASITGTTNQSVSVQAKEPTGVAVVGATCELANKKGKWFVTTPGSVGISRSNDDMQVNCTKDGYAPGSQGVVSVTKGTMVGNIIFGGGIGAIVDHNTGAAYEYPASVQIVMSRIAKAAGEMASSITGQAISGRSKEESLVELKGLFDKNLITREAYESQQKNILGE